jgi:hypothetical protein
MSNNLKIKWVDIDPTTLNMDLDDLARKITPKTKVIMLVHWGGYPNDLDTSINESVVDKIRQYRADYNSQLLKLLKSSFYHLLIFFAAFPSFHFSLM